jgi:hypothetical protein
MSGSAAEILLIEEVVTLHRESIGKSVRVLGRYRPFDVLVLLDWLVHGLIVGWHRIKDHNPADGTVRIADKGHELMVDTKLMGGVVTCPKQLWHFVGELEQVLTTCHAKKFYTAYAGAGKR